MKRILFILLSLLPVGVAYADWRFNPYTQRQDYYESTTDLYIATATLTNALNSEILRATTREDAIAVSTGIIATELSSEISRAIAKEDAIAVSTGIIDANKVNKSGDTMTGSLLVQSSITANAYYGDGSHLTGISASGTIEDCADLSTVMTATHENSIYRYIGATTENYTQYKFYKIIKDGVPIIVDYKHNVAFSGGEIGLLVIGNGLDVPTTTVDPATYWEGNGGWGIYDYFGNRIVDTASAPVRCGEGATGEVLTGTYSSAPSTPIYKQFYKPEEYPFVINPMTTQGDIIVGNSKGDYSRLQKGEEGDVLKTSALFDKGIGWGKVGGYELPQATSSALGGIKADERTTETGEVKIDGETGKLYAPTNSGEIGDMGFAPLGIDESLNLRRYLNGQVISQAQFQSFTTKVKSAVALYTSLATTEENWQAEVTNSPYGICGKFVIDDEAGTIRLPKYPDWSIREVGQAPVVGNGMTLGLTDGTKNYGMANSSGHTEDGTLGIYEGAYGQAVGTTGGSTWSQTTTYATGVTPDGDKSGLIADLVNANTEDKLQGKWFIQVATGIEETLPAIREYEINTPFFFGQSMWTDVDPYNASWLLSNGQPNASTLYPDFWMQLTGVELNTSLNVGDTIEIGGKTYVKHGLSVVLSTDPITGYEFVVNTADSTFILPLLNGQESIFSGLSGWSLYYYVGDTVQDASLINAGAVLGQLSDKISRTAASDKELVVGWGMPDYNSAFTISLPYTATQNGFFFYRADNGTANKVIKYKVSNLEIWFNGYGASHGGMIPLEKGQTLSGVDVSGNINPVYTFVPCIGG